MRDHGQPPQPEQIGAAVGLGIESGAQSARGRADQQAAGLAPRRRRDLAAERVEHRLDRPLQQLQRHVAREAVADHDVRCPGEQVATFGVAGEAEIARGEQRVRLERQGVPLLGLLADREEAHLGARHIEDLCCEDRSHVAELKQVLGSGIRVRARVEKDGGAAPGGDRHGDGRP